VKSRDANDGTIDLDATSPENAEYNTWRQCAGYAAEAIESLWRDGSLRAESDKEKAHRMLSLLAAEPASYFEGD
jgi:hypothetical protein